MTPDPDTIERGLDAFRDMLHDDPLLRAELAGSARQFFAGALPPEDAAARALADRRHMEWFLLERESPHLGAIPIEVLLERSERSASGVPPEEVQSLQRSFASVFEVTGVERGQGVWLSDLASMGEYPAHEPHGSAVLTQGDVIVGRIFPIGDSLYYVSAAAAFFRNAELRSAVRRDLERAREGRRGSLRLAQNEIESMFFARPRVAATDAVEDARRLLLDGGVDAEEIDFILSEFAGTPPPATPLPYGAEDPLGSLLDRLAFETPLDLDAVRPVLIAAWWQLHREEIARDARKGGSETRAPDVIPSATDDVAEVLAEFERRRKNGAPVEPLLRELEQRLALDDGTDSAGEEETAAPDFPGVVGAMIDEFLWESGLEFGEKACAELTILRSFGRFASDIGVFENLRTHDLLRFTCHALPESGELDTADSARELLTALGRFCAWVEEKHEIPLHSEFKDTLRSLQSSLPRIIEANRRRTRVTDPAQGELLEYIAPPTEEGSPALVRDREGREHAVAIDPLLTTWLRPGDRMRGRVQSEGPLAVYCCYPPESRALSND